MEFNPSVREEEPNSLRTPPVEEEVSPLELATGGFTGDTEVMTTAGPRYISSLSGGERLYTYDPTSGLIKLKPVMNIQTVVYDRDLVALKTRRADFRLASDHRIPFRTSSLPRTNFQRSDSFHERSYYKFVNKWTGPHGTDLESVDITDFVDTYEACATYNGHGHSFRAALPDGCKPIRHNSHTGYKFDAKTFKRYQASIEAIADEVTVHAGPNHHRRPYRFNGDDFIQFIGWFVTEGSVYWSTSSDTAQVGIAQKTKRHRTSIRSLLGRMGLTTCESQNGFAFGSKVFGRLVTRLCGRESRTKHLPTFVLTLSERQKRTLLNVLLWGDGNEQSTYYTASKRLADEVLCLCLELGTVPRYTRRDGVWQIYIRKGNDGFKPSKHVRWVESDDDLYRLTMLDYSVIMAGRNGKFQWMGVSNIV